MTDHTGQDPFTAIENLRLKKLEAISEASRAITREFMKETIRDLEEIVPLTMHHDRASLVHTMVLLRVRLYGDLVRVNRPDLYTGSPGDNHVLPFRDSVDKRDAGGA